MSTGWLDQGDPGNGGFVECWGGPAFHRMYNAWLKGDKTTMANVMAWWQKAHSAAGGNFVERYLYPHMCPGCGFGPAREPEPRETPQRVQQAIDALTPLGFFNQTWKPGL